MTDLVTGAAPETQTLIRRLCLEAIEQLRQEPNKIALAEAQGWRVCASFPWMDVISTPHVHIIRLGYDGPEVEMVRDGVRYLYPSPD